MEDVELKRDLFYAFETLITSPLLYYLAKRMKSIDSIIALNEIPLEIIVGVGLSEIFKVVLAFWFYPSTPPPLLAETATYPELPNVIFINTRPRTGKRDSGTSGKVPFNFMKPIEIFKGVVSFIVCLGICHLLMVMFGASLIYNWHLTFQFSIILVFWLFLPLCLVLRPATVLCDIFEINSWSNLNPPLYRAKWRFVAVIAGAWMGSIVIPLDWDRPWQMWPIPNIVSATGAIFLINFLHFFYLIFLLKGSASKGSKSK